MTDNALITVANDLSFMPIMDIAVAMQRREQVIKFTKAIMVQGTDFGVIPGTDKPTLLKPGAEKLTTFFGLAKRFQIIERVEDWTGQDHNGEPFFYYLYRCGLYRGEMLIAEADGSCSSFESKYRWRKSERVCPNCGKANIRKSKQGGGWYCWQKTDGCGATFKAGDPAIESQEVGRIPNPDVPDQVNTVQKMAQKRALVAATLLAVNASEFFTQDLEDYIEGDFTPDPPPPAPEPVKPESKSDSRPVEPVKHNGNGKRAKLVDRIRAIASELETAGEAVALDEHFLLIASDDELTALGRQLRGQLDRAQASIAATFDPDGPETN